jgi:hypothetical protein
MDEETLLANFPTRTESQIQDYRSFIFQPERVSLNSRIDRNLNGNTISGGQEDSLFLQENYYQFSNTLRKPVLHAKSFELLRATIPAATTSIPESESMFFYYKIGNLGVGTNYAPNTAQLTASNIFFVRLLGVNYYPPEFEPPQLYGYNTSFPDYQALVTTLNKACITDPIDQFGGHASYYLTNDVTFALDPDLNLIYFKGNQEVTGTPSRPNYYYVPCGSQDPNIPIFLANLNTYLRTSTSLNQVVINGTLNSRLGFTWNGLPTTSGTAKNNAFFARMVPNPTVWIDDGLILDTYHFPAFANLVYTQNVFLYCDLVGGSTQDTGDDDNLLAVIPMSCSQLGVNMFSSYMGCPLTKIADSFYQVRIVMKTDTNENYYLPNSAPVNLELALKY